MHKSIAGALREETWDADRRGEGTSRIETRLDGEAQARDKADESEWLAATADGGVAVMPGEPNAAALAQPGETEFDALRKLRLAHMKARAAERQAWLQKGHGAYAELTNDAHFLKAASERPRMVCHLSTASLDSQLLHHHMRALCETHLETFFCSLPAESAPMMLNMVELERLPALLLCRDGKVVHQLVGVDRTFTTEGVAYELGEQKLLNFEEGVRYGRSAGGCTAGTAARASDESDEGDDD